MIKVTSGNDIMDEMLGKINYSKHSEAGKLYPFKVRVGVVRRRAPRHSYFDYIRDWGMTDIDKIFNKESFNGKKELVFIFPERWMGVAEQQAFMHNLNNHPEAETLDQVDIITSSPLLIGDFMREQVLILAWEDDDKYNGTL
jgi:hypothetical protein